MSRLFAKSHPRLQAQGLNLQLEPDNRKIFEAIGYFAHEMMA